MAEKKATTKAAAPKKVAAPKKAETTKKAPAKKAPAKKAEVVINVESVGFRAGDVYQALAAAGKALPVAEIAKAAKITVEEAYLGIGWLFKEGKVEGNSNLIALA
ncbi:MAG: winged helix-turn-helix domain-containing protein [Prevotella sp.]|jgi:hypothetical protein|nr:winged helix-turn-helix domain-containing protein [Prevotella sp.]